MNEEKAECVLSEQGDVLFVRNGISHRGCMYHMGYHHHYVHCFCDPENVDELINGMKVTEQFGPVPSFDEKTSKFVNHFE